MHAAIRVEEAARIYSTSGTSGAPSYIPLTRNDLEDWRRIARASYARSGLQAGELLLSTYNAGPFVAGAALDAFDSLGVTHIPLGTGHAEKVLEALRRFRPQTLVCTPSYAVYLSERMQENRDLKRILVAGEPGGGEAAFRERLEQSCGARVYEVMGIGDIAASLWGECPAQAGMHFSGTGSIHVELVDPDSGRPVEMADGAEGELVYTHLRREAAPLLRFRSRDHVRLWVSECPCKRKTIRVRCIGRTDDMLIVRGVNVFPSVIEEQILRDKRLAGTYQILLTRDGHLDNVEVRCELQREFSGTFSPAEVQAISKEMQHHIKTIAGISTRVTVMDHESIPRTLTGKARRVIDERPKQN